ncbi:hypothetical protein BBFGKLBO_00653 [Synechococcus sp. CBW1107]|nr:hypothetical protein BBFGKLBO_00653 [Synechococcus sp. CBW1107]
MIECVSGLPEGTLGFSFREQITADDDDRVLTPALDRALEQHDRLKRLAVPGPAFVGCPQVWRCPARCVCSPMQSWRMLGVGWPGRWAPCTWSGTVI